MPKVRVAADTLARRLVNPGLLVEITGHSRDRRFRYEPYVRLLTDDPPDIAR